MYDNNYKVLNKFHINNDILVVKNTREELIRDVESENEEPEPIAPKPIERKDSIYMENKLNFVNETMKKNLELYKLINNSIVNLSQNIDDNVSATEFQTTEIIEMKTQINDIKEMVQKLLEPKIEKKTSLSAQKKILKK